MTVTERRAREKEAVRQQILEAASSLVIEHGYENLSIRKIAERIEYAPSTIYLYFKDKFEIISTICHETFEELATKLEELEARESDPIKSLRQGLRCYIDFGLAHPSHYMVTFGSRWPLPDEAPETVQRGVASGMRAFGNLVASLERGIQSGRVRALESNMMAQSIWAAIHGLTSLLISMGDDPFFPWVPRERLIENTLDIILRGVLADPDQIR